MRGRYVTDQVSVPFLQRKKVVNDIWVYTPLGHDIPLDRPSKTSRSGRRRLVNPDRTRTIPRSGESVNVQSLGPSLSETRGPVSLPLSSSSFSVETSVCPNCEGSTRPNCEGSTVPTHGNHRRSKLTCQNEKSLNKGDVVHSNRLNPVSRIQAQTIEDQEDLVYIKINFC